MILFELMHGKVYNTAYLFVKELPIPCLSVEAGDYIYIRNDACPSEKPLDHDHVNRGSLCTLRTQSTCMYRNAVKSFCGVFKEEPSHALQVSQLNTCECILLPDLSS